MRKVLVLVLFFDVYQAAIIPDNNWFSWAEISGSFLQDEPHDYPGPIFSDGIQINKEITVLQTRFRSKNESNIAGQTTTESEGIEIATEGVKETTIETEPKTVAQDAVQIEEQNNENVANPGEANAEDSDKTGDQSQDEQPKDESQSKYNAQDEGQSEENAQKNNNVANESQNEETNSNDAEEVEYGSNKIDNNAKGDESDEIKVEKKNYKYKNYYNEYKKKAADARRKKLEDLEMLRKDLQEKYGSWHTFNCLSQKCALECLENGNYGGFCNGGANGSCQCR